MDGLNKWVLENPMAIHAPIALWIAIFSLWWIVLALRFGFGGASYRLGKRRIVFAATLVAVSAWGIYSSSLFDGPPIHWL